MRVPEPAERAAEPQRRLRVAVLERRVERRPHVVVLCLEAREPEELVAAAERLVGLLREAGELECVATDNVVLLAGLCELLAGVVADGGEHREPGFAARVVHLLEQAAVDERREPFECIEPEVGGRRADALRGVQCAPVREDGQSSVQLPLTLREEVVAPRDRVAERALPLRERRTGPRRQVEPALQPLEERLRRKHFAPGGRELDREREPVEPHADLCDRTNIRVRHLEVGPDGTRTLDEQPRRVRLQERLRCRRSGGKPQRRDGILALARDMERLAARDQERQARARRHKLEDRAGGGRDLLEVVHQEQCLSFAELRLQRLRERHRWCLFHADHARDLGQDEAGVGDHRKLDGERAVVELVHEVCCDLHRKARLARAAGTGQGHEPHVVVAYEPADRVELLVPADERRRLRRQIRASALERPQGRELRRQAGDEELVQALRPAQVFEPVLAEVAEAQAVHGNSSRVVSETSTWPPCAAPAMRAAR